MIVQASLILKYCDNDYQDNNINTSNSLLSTSHFIEWIQDIVNNNIPNEQKMDLIQRCRNVYGLKQVLLLLLLLSILLYSLTTTVIVIIY